MLINCPECQHQISDRARACPHCGHPTTTPLIPTLIQRLTSILTHYATHLRRHITSCLPQAKKILIFLLVLILCFLIYTPLMVFIQSLHRYSSRDTLPITRPILIFLAILPARLWIITAHRLWSPRVYTIALRIFQLSFWVGTIGETVLFITHPLLALLNLVGRLLAYVIVKHPPHSTPRHAVQQTNPHP